jgi:hypothetical protein
MLRSDFMLNDTNELTWYWLGSRSTGTFDRCGWNIQFRLEYRDFVWYQRCRPGDPFRDVIKEIFLQGSTVFANR